MIGPIDYIVVSFKGNNFDGSVLEAIKEAVDKKIINLLALSLITKDADGNVETLSINDIKDDDERYRYLFEFSKSYKTDSKLIKPDDIDEISELMENNTAAGLLIIEQLWAIPLKKALIKANGLLIGEGRIHPEAARELENKKEDQ